MSERERLVTPGDIGTFRGSFDGDLAEFINFIRGIDPQTVVDEILSSDPEAMPEAVFRSISQPCMRVIVGLRQISEDRVPESARSYFREASEAIDKTFEQLLAQPSVTETIDSLIGNTDQSRSVIPTRNIPNKIGYSSAWNHIGDKMSPRIHLIVASSTTDQVQIDSLLEMDDLALLIRSLTNVLASEAEKVAKFRTAAPDLLDFESQGAVCMEYLADAEEYIESIFVALDTEEQ